MFAPCDLGTWKIKIGFNTGTQGIEKSEKGGYISVSSKGKLEFTGTADLKEGITILITNSGKITFGDQFSCNRNCCFSSDSKIEFGNDVLLGWNVNIRTSDGHPVCKVDDERQILNLARPVRIGNHVWIAANADILKGVDIQDNCIIGYRSCVTKSILEKNVVIAGYPARIVKRDIQWRREL